MLAIFESISKKIRNNLLLCVSVDTDFFENFRCLVQMFLIIYDDINLGKRQFTVQGVHDLSMTSYTLSSFLAFRRLLFLDFPIFYSLILMTQVNISLSYYIFR